MNRIYIIGHFNWLIWIIAVKKGLRDFRVTVDLLKNWVVWNLERMIGDCEVNVKIIIWYYYEI